MRFLALTTALLFAASAHAQTMSGPANGKSCSDLVQECVEYNRARGADTGRCQTYKSACMKSGTYKDRNRTITDVAKR